MEEDKKIDTSESLSDEEMHKKIIDGMTQIEMARLYRFAPAGHPYFKSGSSLCEYFEKRFNELGGMTPVISRAIEPSHLNILTIFSNTKGKRK